MIARRHFLAASGVLAAGCATPEASPPARPTTVRLATGSKGGGFLLYGEAVAAALAGSHLQVQPLETQGTADNIQRLQTGQVEAALLVMGPAWDAWQGQAQWNGKPARHMRALLPMYETPFHVAASGTSGIRSVAQLAGKRVGVGPARGTAETFMRGLLEALGMTVTVVNGSPSEHARQLARGEIDAFWFGAGLPVPAFVEAAQAAPVRVFGLTDAERSAFIRRFPYFSPYRVPAGTYAGQSEAVESVAVWNFVAVTAGAPPELGYWLTRLILERRGDVVARYAAASATSAEHLKANTFIPFDAGAERYFRERGVTVPRIAA